MKSSAQALSQLKSAPSGVLLYSENPAHLFVQEQKVLSPFPSWQRVNEAELLKDPSALEGLFQTRSLFSAQGKGVVIEGASDKLVFLLTPFVAEAAFRNAKLPLLVLAASYLGPSSKLRLFYEKHPTFLSVGCFAPTPLELTSYIKGLFDRLGLTATPEAISLLVHHYRDDAPCLATEIDKLAGYAFPGTHMEAEMVRNVVTAVLPFDENALELFLKRDRAQLVLFLNRVLAEDRNPISIIKFFQASLRRLWQLVSLREENMTLEQAALKMRPPYSAFQLKNVASSLATWTSAHFLKALHNLLIAEKQAKEEGALAEVWLMRALLASLKR